MMTPEFIAILAGGKLVAGVSRFYHKESTDMGRNRVGSTA